MKNLNLIIATLAALSLISISVGVNTANEELLRSYQGNLSEKTLRNMSIYQILGPLGETVAQTVKFEAPGTNWNLRNVTILGWDGYNGALDSIPNKGLMVIEIRDKDLNLLYRFSDIQTPYTNYIFNMSSILFPITIDLPAIAVSDEFYVCFYDRGVVSVGFEFNNSTKNSYFYDRSSRMLIPANLPPGSNNTVNWIMRVGGS